jgi:hypothetical protein
MTMPRPLVPPGLDQNVEHLTLGIHRRSLKKLSALKHLLFLPSLIALLVKESGAITAARIGSREAFKALTAV